MVGPESDPAKVKMLNDSASFWSGHSMTSRIFDFILVGSADEKLPPAKSWDGYSNGDPVIHKNDQQKWRQSRIAACLVIAFITVMILPKVFGCVF
jgi:hypothetical protein